MAKGACHQFDEKLKIADIETLYSQLQQMLNDADEITLDASKVKEIDTATIQLLSTFVCNIDQNGGKVIWQDVSPEMMTHCQLLGLTTTLQLEQTE